MEERLSLQLSGCTFRVLADYVERSCAEEKTAYFGIDDCGTWEQALHTLQVIYGDYTNYGYLYAQSCQGKAADGENHG